MSGDRGDSTSGVSSNANVEKLFKEKKYSVHKLRHNKVGRYVRVESQHVERVLKKIKMESITSSKAYRKKIARETVMQDLKWKQVEHTGTPNGGEAKSTRDKRRIKPCSVKAINDGNTHPIKIGHVSESDSEDGKTTRKMHSANKRSKPSGSINASKEGRGKRKAEITLDLSSTDPSALRDVEEP